MEEEKLMDKRKRKVILLIGILITLFVFFSIYITLNDFTVSTSDNVELKNGWIVDVNGIRYDDVNISDFVLEQMMKGDIITYSCTLPTTDIPNTILVIYTIHSKVEAFLGDELIYSYGAEEYEQDKLLGYGYHLITLPSEYAGKTLTVINYVDIDRAFTTIKTPVLANGITYIKNFIIDKKIPLAINVFLFVFGITLLFVSAIYMIYDREFFKLLCAGAFSIGVAAWSICNYNLIILFTYEPILKTYIEFGALYCCPIPFILYFWKDYQKSDSKYIKISYKILLLCQLLFTVSSFALQYLNIIKLPEVLFVQHVLLFLMITLMAISGVRQVLQHRFHYKALVIGLAVMLFFGLIDIVNFNIGKYLTNSDNSFNSALCWGTFLFVIGQILDFCNEIRDNLYETAKTEALEKMAYTDALTGIANRRYCEEMFDSIEQSDLDYGLLAFDLNNLKETNDIKGHEKGDMLIKEFAGILQRVFGNESTVGRMGGDEFLVIIPNVKSVNVDNLLENMKNQIKISNEIQQDINISVAYGFCQKNEYNEMNIKAVYRKADSRMYDMKLSMKYKQDINENK